MTRALNQLGLVVPYVPPPASSTTNQRHTALADFLASIDVLWADLYPDSADAVQLRHRLGLACPAVLFAAGVMPKAAEAMLFPWQNLLRPDDQLIFSCEADRAIWHTLVRRSDMREWVVPLSVDDTIFHPRGYAERAATRARYGLPADAPLLLYAGRLNIQKNLHTLLRLLRAVRLALPDVLLCLVGDQDDIILGEFGARNTGYVAWLRQLAEELGVAGSITFVEAQGSQDLAALYASADVLVNASIYHRENFGLALAEAQACGLPVVCSAWGGFKDVVREGETGYFMDAVMTKHGVRVDWAMGAQRAIKVLVDRSLHAQLRVQAHNWARQRFSNAALVEALGPIIASPEGRERRAPHSRPAYEPSAFARRYEAHKRRCGWYADTPRQQRRWYPPMFQGRDYALYETLFGLYATYLAAATPADAIRDAWIPYAAAGMRLDAVRQVVETDDPIWSQRRYLQPLEWGILTLVDEITPVGQIVGRLSAGYHTTDRDVRAALWRLYVEGIILLNRAGA
jgi:glycosyltransferase involved in cell wall biosynthesis